jgi:molecular chaperone DnaK
MPCLGIDYGTSTTLFATSAPGRLEVLKDEAGEEIVPSIIAFPPSGKVQIGRAARSRALVDPQNTLYSVKRILGQPWHAPDVGVFRKQYPFQMERGADGMPRFVTRAGLLTADEVTTSFLAHTRELEALRKRAFSHVVVAVPERAELRQQTATLAAVTAAGFPSPDTVSEPAAAVLPYVNKEPKPAMLLVYDLGGGTFDTAVVRWDGRRPVVLSSAGDSYLGGDDLDSHLTDWGAGEILKVYHWDVRTSARSYQTLRYLCEQAKINLSIGEEAVLNLSSVDDVLVGKTLRLSRQLVETFAEPLLKRTFEVCSSALGFVGFSPSELDGVVMAGGSTYMPYVRRRVAEHFGRPLLTTLPADRLVAMGAALLALMRDD